MSRLLVLPLAALALVVALALSACTGSSTSPPPSSNSASSPAASAPAPETPSTSPATGTSTDWYQYHANAARTGDVSGLPLAGRLRLAWSRPLGGAVTGQPLVIGSTVIAATEQDEVYGLSRATGAVLWHTKVGTPVPGSQQPCGDLDPLGIASTPVYDPQTRLVYVVGQAGKSAHVLAGLTLSGRIALRRAVPSPDHHAYYDQQRGALALGDGRIYVVFGGHAGDCGPYIGSVVGMPASGTGKIVSYRVPTKAQAGIWAPAGPVIASNGTVYISDGNGATTAARFDGSDSVTALSPDLKRIGWFAPPNWKVLSANDLDLGSTSPALLSNGQILQVGKSMTGFLLNGSRLGGVGGQIAQAQVCAAFGGTAVSGQTVYEPCNSGLTAVGTAHDMVRVIWRGPAGVGGSPVLGGGAVFVASPTSGVLDELDPATGRVRYQIKVAGSLPHFVSPSLSGGLILIGTTSGVVAIAGA